MNLHRENLLEAGDVNIWKAGESFLQLRKGQGWGRLRSEWQRHCMDAGVGCVRAKSLQRCSALCDLIDCSPPGSFVQEILQARILE